MEPPSPAVVGRSTRSRQIQARDRTQPGLPLKPGKCGTMTHDYKRNGTTTLFAALNSSRHRDRALHETASPPRIYPLPQHQPGAPFRPASHPCHPRQLRHPQASQGSPWLATIRDGCFISPRPRPPGSTPSRASSRPSPAGGSDAASSNPSTICRTRSRATSTPTTAIVDRSYGPLPPKRSSKNWPRSLYLLSEMSALGACPSSVGVFGTNLIPFAA